MPSLHDILVRTSKIAGLDLNEVVAKSKAKHRAEIDGSDPVDELEAQKKVVAETRRSLPKRARKRFDRELAEQRKSPSDRKAKSAIISNRKNKAKIAKLEKLLKQSGIENPTPKEIPHHLVKQTSHIIADQSGWAVRYYGRVCWHKVGVGLAHRAALSFDSNGKPLYSYVGYSRGAIRARAVFAYGLLLLCLSEPTGRKNQGWSRLIKKIPMEAFVALLSDPSGYGRLHRNTVGGNYHRADDKDIRTDGKVGYLRALQNTGLVYTRQARWRPGEDPKNIKGWHDIAPEEMAGKIHPSGWYTSTLRYWIVADRYTDVKDAARKAELWLAWLSGNLPWQRDEHGAFIPNQKPAELPPTEIKKPPD